MILRLPYLGMYRLEQIVSAIGIPKTQKNMVKRLRKKLTVPKDHYTIHDQNILFLHANFQNIGLEDAEMDHVVHCMQEWDKNKNNIYAPHEIEDEVFDKETGLPMGWAAALDEQIKEYTGQREKDEDDAAKQSTSHPTAIQGTTNEPENQNIQ